MWTIKTQIHYSHYIFRPVFKPVNLCTTAHPCVVMLLKMHICKKTTTTTTKKNANILVFVTCVRRWARPTVYGGGVRKSQRRRETLAVCRSVRTSVLRSLSLIVSVVPLFWTSCRVNTGGSHATRVRPYSRSSSHKQAIQHNKYKRYAKYLLHLWVPFLP